MNQDNIIRFLNDLEDIKPEDIEITDYSFLTIRVPEEVVQEMSTCTDWKNILHQCGMRVLGKRAHELAAFFKADQDRQKPKPVEEPKVSDSAEKPKEA